jgi:glycosyltransferase involved in cell wall biosynthesis
MDISVIVSTFNRSTGLIACLDAIADSILAAAPATGEVIVIDNNSTDDTPKVIRDWAAQSRVPVNTLLEKNQGVSFARNAGIRAAAGRVLFFTDDDCRPDAGCLAAALRLADADTAPVLRGGRVELGDPADMPFTIKTDMVAQRWEKSGASIFDDKPGTSIIGCNMTMPRALIDRIGLFDERYGPGTKICAAEDTDYITRVYESGLALEYSPEIVVYHHHGRRTPDQAARLQRNYAIATGGYYAKYIFSHWRVLGRWFWWDVKNAWRELHEGRNLFLPEAGFYHRDVVWNNIKGGYYFAVATLRQKLGLWP